MWDARDWRVHKAEERQHRLESLREMRYQRLDEVPIAVIPQPPLPRGFTLHPKPRGPSRGARSDAVDKLLDKHVGPRRSSRR